MLAFFLDSGIKVESHIACIHKPRFSLKFLYQGSSQSVFEYARVIFSEQLMSALLSRSEIRELLSDSGPISEDTMASSTLDTVFAAQKTGRMSTRIEPS